MRRRGFILLAAWATGASTTRLWGDHRILSLNPLIVDFDLSTLQSCYTAVDNFYIRKHFEIPAVPQPYSLRIDGKVQNIQILQMNDPRRIARKRVGAVPECACDPVKTVSLVSDALWEGWPLGDVISLVGPMREGAHVHLFGRDGYARSVPVERAMADGLVISGLNGRPLLRNHGAPWRALFPGWYGADSVKWLQRISLASTPLPPEGSTYLQVWRTSSGSLETEPLPRVLVNSVITKPVEGAVLHAGELQSRGVAWSGSGKIRDVQVSPDGESFGARQSSVAMRANTTGPSGTVRSKSTSEGRSNYPPKQPKLRQAHSRLRGPRDEWIPAATTFGTACAAW